MRRVLIWIEPHPIRESFTTFAAHGQFLSDVVPNDGCEISSKIFSNQQTLELLAKRRGSDSSRFIYPTETEQRNLEMFLGPWNARRIKDWLSLVRGVGEISMFYRTVLDRLMSDHHFDTFISWSDNGALRGYAQDNRLRTFHCELGPTRGRFGETFYIDPVGTNGFAAIRQISDKLIDAPNKTTINNACAFLSSFTPGSVIEKQPLTGTSRSLQDKPKALVPLQLADDLNALLHSPYDSPAAFVQATVPELIAQGYKVVVKGHPAATANRAGDVALKQREALAMASDLGGDVEIIEASATWHQYLSVMNDSDLVCSINSSVAFEAMLIGKNVHLYGDSVFDFGKRLKISDNKERSRKYLSFISSKYLHPLRPQISMAAIKRIILMPNYLEDMNSFWESWVTTVDHSSNWSDGEVSNGSLHRSLAGFFKQKGRLIGHVDAVTINATREGGSDLSIEGWIDTTKVGDGVQAISLLNKGRVMVTERRFYPRYDVVNNLGRSNAMTGFRFDLIGLRQIPDEISIRAISSRGLRYETNAIKPKEHHSFPIAEV